jgi:hypothetical protein
MAQSRKPVLIGLLIVALCEFAGAGQSPRSAGASSAQPQERFFNDHPIQVMPAPLPVQKPVKQDLDETLDFWSQSRIVPEFPARPAGAVNTMGDVPDSEWFTNRHGLRRMSRSELRQGPGPVEHPIPPFTITGGKLEGIMPGFVMKDARGRRYFVKTDPIRHPEMSSAADVIVSRFLYAIGYNTPRNEAVDLKLSDLRVSGNAKIKMSGEGSREMTSHDVEEMVRRIPHYENGTFRIMASRAIEGESIGPFLYAGTRPDDPNDLVPHQDRRDLRGLRVFAAWLNNTDAKASNSLDVVVTAGGVRSIRHYLLDFGSALGSDGDAPKDPRLGHEYMLSTPGATIKQILGLGLVPESWERAHFPRLPAVGNFESELFDPETWKPDYPNPAFINHLPDDDYWAAKQVMAFTGDDIRAIVETARYSDNRSAEYMISTLAARRDKIGRAYFTKVLPLDHFRVEHEQLIFDDLAVQYGFHVPRSYAVRWSSFDNLQQKHVPILAGESGHLPAKARESRVGSYFCAGIGVPGEPGKRVSVYLRKESAGYKVVGLDR